MKYQTTNILPTRPLYDILPLIYMKELCIMKHLKNITLPVWIPIIASVAFLVTLGAMYIRHQAMTYPYPFQARPDPAGLDVVSTIDKSNCRLCGFFPIEAPCLFNTSTGEVSTLSIYPTDPSNDLAIKEPDRDVYGYAHMTGNKIFTSFSMPDDDKSYITFNVDQFGTYEPTITKEYVCQDCLNKINHLNPHSNLVIADTLFSRESIIYVYDILPKTTLSIRHYTIIFEQVDNYNRIHTTVTSSYFN